ncbi:MAG: PKD domain-containing protein, partial [Flavobacteriales bacterium]|nr:PKD domain-containing protein [Flavobacteriales bacterium]
TFNTSTHVLDGYVLGMWSGGGNNLNGEIVEIILYDRYLTDFELCQVENYLRYRYFPNEYRGPVDLGPDKNGLCDTILDATTNYETYLWSTGDTTSQVIINQSGEYWVTVIDTFGCTSSDTIQVNFPVYNLPPDTIICYGGSVVWDLGLGGGFTYLWSTGDTLDSITITVSGAYNVTITDTANLLCSQESILLNFSVDSFPNIASLSNDTTLCKGSVIGLQQGEQSAVSYVWSTGDTTATITIDSAGLYTLLVSDSNGCSANDSINITISGEVPISFFKPDTVCFGDSTTFTDSSYTLDSSNIINWDWDFGDTDTSDSINPTHLYTSPGFYNVTLTVTTDSGCVNSLSKNVPVVTSPTLDFQVNTTCTGSITQFSAVLQLDSLDSITSINWDFGNSTFAANLNPSTTYSAEGAYTVTLTINTKFGCSDSIAKTVNISSIPSQPLQAFPPYDYYSQNDTITLSWSASMCGAVSILQLDTVSTFATPTVQDTLVPSFSFLSGLSFGQTYYWRVKYYDGVNVTSWSNVGRFHVIDPSFYPNLQLWLRSDSVSVLGVDTLDRFLDLSGNGRDAIRGSGTKPTYISSDSLVNNHASVRFDGLDDFMEGSGLLGGFTDYTILAVCRTSVFKTFNWIYNNAPSGAANSFSLTGNATGNYLFWDRALQFQSGTDTMSASEFHILTAVNSNDSLPKVRMIQNGFPTGDATFNTSTHVLDGYVLGMWSAGGNNLNGEIVEIILYDRYLTDFELCQVENYLRYRYFPDEYVGPIDLGPDKNGLCDTILDATTNYETYLWSTGDTTSQIIINQSGEYWVAVIDTFGCASSDTIQAYLPEYNLPPETIICYGGSVVWDLGLGSGFTYLWSTGDTSESIDIILPGAYNVTITDTANTGCSKQSILLNFSGDSFELTMAIDPTDTICQGEVLGLSSGAAEAVSYIWSTADTTPTILITTSGTYSVFVTDSNGCTAQDTVIKTVIGVAPNAAFTFVSICEGDTTSFFDTSDTSASGGIVTWLWDFGDGNGDTLQNPKHFYSSPGTYLTSLTVVTAGDCSSGSMQTISIGNRPTANFGPLNGCSNTPIVMLDQSTITNDIITDRTWVIDTLDTVFGSAVAVVYPYEGNYAVTLVATSMNGCSDSITQTVVIDETPDPGFDYTLTCGSTEVLFEDASVVNSTWILANGYSWSFGDGNASTDNPTSTTYTIPGDYIVTLNVLAVNGCSATVSDTISVVPITVDADFEEDSICFNKSFQFMDASTAVGDSVILWFWDIEGIGTSNVKNPVVTYPDSGIYSVSLAVTSSENCVDSITKDVLVHGLPSVDFNFSPQFGVNLQEPVNFTNLSNGCKEYRWDFGDGMDTVTSENPTHQYSDTGVYQVTLHCLSDFKCPDSITKIIDVRPASLDVEVAAVTADCQPEIIQNITVTLVNKGSREITFLDLFVRIEGREPVREQWNGFLEPFELETYTFAVAFPLSATQGTNYICVWAESPNGSTDEVLTNNEQCIACDNKFEIIDLFPNPATDQINVWFVLPRAEFLEAKLYDKRGTYLGIAFSGNGIKGLNQVTISTADMTHGLYTLRIAYLESSYVRTFVVH